MSLAVCGTVSVSAGQAQDAEKSFYAGKTVRMIVGSGPAGFEAYTPLPVNRHVPKAIL